jgi:hypothetical protein
VAVRVADRARAADRLALAGDPVLAGVVPGAVDPGTVTRLTLTGRGLTAGTAVLDGDRADEAIRASGADRRPTHSPCST